MRDEGALEMIDRVGEEYESYLETAAIAADATERELTWLGQIEIDTLRHPAGLVIDR